VGRIADVRPQCLDQSLELGCGYFELPVIRALARGVEAVQNDRSDAEAERHVGHGADMFRVLPRHHTRQARGQTGLKGEGQGTHRGAPRTSARQLVMDSR
jgi:hypothetical protein